MIDLRIVAEDFSSELAALWSTTFVQAYDGVHTPGDITTYCADNFTELKARAALTDPSAVCTVAFDGTAPLGFYIATTHDAPIPLDAPAGELKQLYLLPCAYSTGLGGRLLADAMSALAARGRTWMWLAVSVRNSRAQTFYMKNGFASLGPDGNGPVFQVGAERLPSTLMARRIDGFAAR